MSNHKPVLTPEFSTLSTRPSAATVSLEGEVMLLMQPRAVDIDVEQTKQYVYEILFSRCLHPRHVA